MVPVSRLPDLCLLALFRQMTLQDKIGARKVCRRWADLVPEANIKRRELILLLGEGFYKEFEYQIDDALFKNRRALKQLLNADGTAMYPTQRLTSWNSLLVKSMKQATAEEIASTFTETKELQVTVYYPSQSPVDSLVHLLKLWSHQLISLQIIEGYSLDIDKQTTTHLFPAINSLSVLKKLHLNLCTMTVPNLSIVSQLEELRFYSFGTSAKWFAQCLQQYGEGNRGLTRIEFHNSYSSHLEPFTALSEHLRHCFTRLDFCLTRDLATLSGHFGSLTTLNLNPYRTTVRQLFTHLATLYQLIHLYLTISSDSFSANDQEHHHHLLLPQVKSVKALEMVLMFPMPAHQQLAKMKIAWTVPNVEVIHFVFHFDCTECNIGTFWRPSKRAMSCLRQLFTPLKRDCTKLRLIKHNEEQAQGTAEELLAE